MKRKVQKKRGNFSRKSLAIAPAVKKTVAKELVDIGKLSFFLGILLSVAIGLILGISNVKVGLGIGIAYSILFILGLVVGLLNITIEESGRFLTASITFLVAANLNIYVIKLTLPLFGAVISQIFFAIGVFVAPAATIVALKSMYILAKKR